MKKRIVNIMVVATFIVAFMVSVKALESNDSSSGVLFGSMELKGNTGDQTPIMEKTSQINQYFTVNSALTVITNPCNNCKFNYTPHHFEGDEDKTTMALMDVGVGEKVRLIQGSVAYTGRVYVNVGRADFTIWTTHLTYRWDYDNVLGL